MRKILIGTPLKGDVSRRYFSLVLKLLMRTTEKQQFCPMFISGTAIHFARDEIVAQARKDGFTHILWWDADLVPTEAQIDRMLSFDEDIVCAMYCKKQVETGWHITAIKGEPTRSDGLQSVFKCAIGFSIMKISVFERLAAAYPDDACHSVDSNGKTSVSFQHFFPMRVMGPNSAVGRLEGIREYLHNGGESIDMIRQIANHPRDGGNTLTGEDYSFCRNVLGAGMKILLDTTSIIKHTGECDYPIDTAEMEKALKEQWRKV